MISLPTKAQWVSVFKNAVLAFFASFAVALSASPDLGSAAVKAAAVAGVMAAYKVVEKFLTEPRVG